MDERGFTLVELLTVMLIGDALAAIALDQPLPVAVAASVTGGGTGYRLSKLSHTGTVFRIDRSPTGISRTCTHPGAGGCWGDSSW